MPGRQFIQNRYGLSLAFILTTQVLCSQVTGEWVFTNYPETEIYDLVEHDNKLFLVLQTSVGANIQNFEYLTRVMEVNRNKSNIPEETQVRLELNHHSSVVIPGRLNRLGDGWIYVNSSIESFGGDTIFAYTLNSQFHLVNLLRRPVSYGMTSYTVLESDEQYVGIGSILQTPDSLFTLACNTAEGTCENIEVFNTVPKVNFITSLAYDRVGNSFLAFHLNGIAQLDPNFNLVENLTNLSTSQHGTVDAADNQILSFGAKSFEPGANTRDLILQAYDDDMNVVYSETFGVTGKDDYPFINTCLGATTSYFVIGGNLTGPVEMEARLPNKFFLSRYDLSMNRDWYREYGGDGAYRMRGLHLLDDGTCVVFGAKSIDQG